jgi:molybdenum cofactor cytidylyltransferase
MGSRYFAAVPAAGYSVRMGRAKLLLPLSGRPLILHTIEAWQRSGVDRVVVVVRPGDAALAEVVRTAGVSSSKFQVGERENIAVCSSVDLVVPQSPPGDMKASVQAALLHIEGQYDPTVDDAFLVAPADMPRLSARIVKRLMEWHAKDSMLPILAPVVSAKRGHPVLFSWRLAGEVFSLAANEGLDAVVRRHEPRLVECGDLVAAGEEPFGDVDTMEEYQRVTKRQ